MIRWIALSTFRSPGDVVTTRELLPRLPCCFNILRRCYPQSASVTTCCHSDLFALGKQQHLTFWLQGNFESWLQMTVCSLEICCYDFIIVYLIRELCISLVARRAVAFGTTLDRELLPLKVPANRFGNELGLRGAPNRGPGCYDNAEVTNNIIAKRFHPSFFEQSTKWMFQTSRSIQCMWYFVNVFLLGVLKAFW